MPKDYQHFKEAHKSKAVRDPHGKFVKGNPGGPGAASLNKDRVRYNDILKNCATDEEFQKVAEKLLGKAQDGESWAIKELLDRLMGKPKQFIEADLTTTHVDPQIIIGQVSVLLGLTKEEEPVIELDQTKAKQIEGGKNE